MAIAACSEGPTKYAGIPFSRFRRFWDSGTFQEFYWQYYDKQTKAINFRALAQKIQLKILELKDATSICRRDMASFNSRILS
jgi:hypothetical protein